LLHVPQVVNKQVLSARLLWGMGCCQEFGFDDCRAAVDVFAMEGLFAIAAAAVADGSFELPSFEPAYSSSAARAACVRAAFGSSHELTLLHIQSVRNGTHCSDAGAMFNVINVERGVHAGATSACRGLAPDGSLAPRSPSPSDASEAPRVSQCLRASCKACPMRSCVPLRGTYAAAWPRQCAC
jgi:hypothetical protein